MDAAVRVVRHEHGSRPRTSRSTIGYASAARRRPWPPRTACSRRFATATRRTVRDIGVSRLEGGKWTPTTLVAARTTGMIDGCPVNGPVMSARGRDVAAAWFTVKNDQGLAVRRVQQRRRPHVGVRRIRAGRRRARSARVDVELLDDGIGAASAGWNTPEGASDFKVRRVEKAGAQVSGHRGRPPSAAAARADSRAVARQRQRC